MTTSVKTRLIILVSFLLFALLAIGGVAFEIARHAEDVMDGVHEHQTIPARELARIRRLVVENSGQVFRAIQHNPAFEYASLHDHPLENHLKPVESNIKWLDETVASLRKGLLPDSKERELLDRFEPLYRKYTQEVLLPTIEALRRGDYSNKLVGSFIQANGSFEKQINPLMREIAEAQQQSAADSYAASEAFNQKMKLTAGGVLLLALVVSLLLAIKTITSITGPLREMQEQMRRAAQQHDFTGQVEVRQHDEIGQTADDFNTLLRALRQSLGEIRQRILQVDSATNQLNQLSTQTAKAAVDTSGAAAAIAASVEQMSVSIVSVADHSHDALGIAETAGERSQTGGAVIGNAVASMAEIVKQVHAVGASITELGEHTERISSVVQVIHDVAEQTNLLALNAAIEAARAGEQGRGFAVVADEVRKLAERTNKATGEISDMISDIQSRSKQAVSTMDNSVAELERGAELAQQAGQVITEIQAANASVSQVFADIDLAVREQSSVSQEIAQRVEHVANASESSSTHAANSANEAANIERLTQEMRQAIEKFRI